MAMICNILIMACGVYMIYWAVQMKSSHKIPVMLVGKSFPLDRAKDPAGFIRFTFPFTLFTGIFLLVVGMAQALELLAAYPFADTAVSLLLVVVVVLYGMILMKAQRKYLVGMDK
ncbi:MAG: hypothetical protein NC337_10790 [Roseburia sp.]|nr:hypothetical protein [Roseburia sp.]